MTVQRETTTQPADSSPPLLPADGQVSRPMTLTVFTSAQPTRLTKVLTLADGKLQKTAAASMQMGRAQRVEVRDMAELAQLLDSLTEAQAVAWGVCAHEAVDVVPQDAEASTPGAIARTRQHFSFPPAPGVLMLDHDGAPGEQLDAASLRQRLIDACPALASAPMLWRPSVSAGVRAPDGSPLTGITRHRLYVPVTDASRIPEAGKALVALLWAAGHGWFEVGRAGQALERTLVDAAVWQPERLDFAAPPVLKDGLTREGVAPVIHGDGAAQFDLAQIVADADTLKRAAATKKAAREAVKGSCDSQRERWATEQAPQLAARRGITPEKAREVLRRASEHRVLMGDFVLTAQDGATVSVGTVLDAPDRWHNERFADPLDPDADRRVAVVNLKSGARPYLFSHRHGGVRFELMRQSSRVQVGRGMRIATTDAVLAVLKTRGELFDFGEGTVAYVSEGKARPVSPDWLLDHMGRVCDFYSVKLRSDGEGDAVREEIPEDAPSPVARAILAKHGDRGFHKLLAVTTAPTLRTDGSILDTPGHDAASGLLYYSEHPSPPRVPNAPSPAQALEALRFLWKPVRDFPVVDDVGRGVVLHGLLTAALRASLPTAPGIGLDAPAAGTGKTLLARCMGILATGTDPAILPPADTDEETRKRLFSALREGQRVVLWDNVREPLGCAALDSFLTASTFADRILGSSETASLPNRALFIATGNNLRLTSDTCRRVLLARLDAETEKPYTRDFSFDPAQMLAAHRQQYVVAALTIIRAYIAAGRPKMASGRTASFEVWDDLVRQPLCWLSQLAAQAGVPDLPTFADPVEAAARAFEQDPETTKHSALLEAWHAVFGSVQTTVATAIRRAETDDALGVALEEIAGQRGAINSRMLGRWIERMAGRIVGGKLFVRIGIRAGTLHWAVQFARKQPGENTPKPTKPATADADGPACGGKMVGLEGFVSDGLSTGLGAAELATSDTEAF
ncbi:hypothetical protein [Azohydromonas lata]|uniref:Uncharacterized protein n=1 Tax=Azohydromonas lata TaxID=45677 RepID=A0ABU5IFI5_9BURK|nr:hypothetical protein [Azohydromonas lata]MDZ5457892.1 hypothetical protein [Azohydromonas lata]